MHVADQARISADDAALPGSAPPRSGRRGSPPPTDSAYERPYERLDPGKPDPETAVDDPDAGPQPIRTFDAAVVDVEATDEYTDHPETPARTLSPVAVGLAAVLVAIIIAGIIVATAGKSDDGDAPPASGADGVFTRPSAGGFGSMLPDGTIVCARAPAAPAGTAPRTAVAGTVEMLAAPATWSGREIAKGRLQGTGPGLELTLNPSDHDRAVPQSGRISVLSIEASASYFPDQFLVAALPAGNATTTRQDCQEYGPYTALRLHRVEINGSTTLSTRYVVLYDKSRRGSAAFFVFEDPRNSADDADFFESLITSAKLLK
jgi:hypothetical protein